ncbi:MAG: methyltransferase domain-containing protein [Spirochaetota bacterium]
MSINNLYIPFPSSSSIGGPSTFMHNLKQFLDNNKIKYLSSPENASAIFFPIQYDENVIKEIKNRNGKVIQRLDGIYYPSKHGDKYIELNSELKKIYLNYSDYVIFQSKYSKQQCYAMLGEKTDNQYNIILNGVDKKIFHPLDNNLPVKIDRSIKFVTTGNFRNIDMLEPIINALDYLNGKIDFKLSIVGPIVNVDINNYLDRDYIIYCGNKDLKGVANILNDSNIFIYSHLNPPCPNSVLEAISCGLPVVGFNSGAMSELCWFSKDLLAPVSDEIFQRYEDFDYKKLAEKIMLAVENYDKYKKIAMDHTHLYSFEECGNSYINVFNNLLMNGTETYKEKPAKFNLAKKLFNKITKKNKLSSINNPDIVKKSSNDVVDYLLDIIRKKSDILSPPESLCFLFDIDNKLYDLEGRASIRYGDGIHTKHKHIKYHDFFIENTPAGSKVLDIGCGNGALAYDIATHVLKVTVYGIDLNQDNISVAKNRFMNENIVYVCGDALKDLPNDIFDVIVLSNVLEHLENRVEFLNEIKTRYNPNKFLIRIPIFERDWRVPLKRELGIDYRLDSTHCIEYSQDEFFNEIAQAGLQVESYKINWGEIWAVVVKK